MSTLSPLRRVESVWYTGHWWERRYSWLEVVDFAACRKAGLAVSASAARRRMGILVAITFYNYLTRRKEEFTPLHDPFGDTCADGAICRTLGMQDVCRLRRRSYQTPRL